MIVRYTRRDTGHSILTGEGVLATLPWICSTLALARLYICFSSSAVGQARPLPERFRPLARGASGISEGEALVIVNLALVLVPEDPGRRDPVSLSFGSPSMLLDLDGVVLCP